MVGGSHLSETQKRDRPADRQTASESETWGGN